MWIRRLKTFLPEVNNIHFHTVHIPGLLDPQITHFDRFEANAKHD